MLGKQSFVGEKQRVFFFTFQTGGYPFLLTAYGVFSAVGGGVLVSRNEAHVSVVERVRQTFQAVGRERKIAPKSERSAFSSYVW